MRNIPMMLLLCVAASAQQQPGTLDPSKDPVKIAEKDAADKESATFFTSNTVVIAPTTVLNKRGDYVNGLQLQDFQLFDNNKLQKITADVHDEPLSLVVAVQKSSNLNEILPKIQRIGSMLNDIIAGADGETAVIAFDHRIVVAQDFTGETGKITETMKKLIPGSSQHAVDDAVLTGIDMLKKRPSTRRRVLLLISEKRDKGSTVRVREVLTEAEFANVVIYSLDISSVMAGLTSTGMPPPPPSIPAAAQHMPAGVDATPTLVEQNYYVGNYIPMFVDIFQAAKSIFVEEPVVVFTRFTGGKEYPFVSEKSLERAITGISQELHSQYLLSYTPNNPADGGFHEIRVTVNRPQLEIRTRPGYWVAARPEQ